MKERSPKYSVLNSPAQLFQSHAFFRESIHIPLRMDIMFSRYTDFSQGRWKVHVRMYWKVFAPPPPNPPKCKYSTRLCFIYPYILTWKCLSFMDALCPYSQWRWVNVYNGWRLLCTFTIYFILFKHTHTRARMHTCMHACTCACTHTHTQTRAGGISNMLSYLQK